MTVRPLSTYRSRVRPPSQPKEPQMRLSSLLRPTTVVRAHCDIPCGIYDPAEALLAAKTVARMVEIINGIEGNDTNARNKFSRCVAVKEQHAEKVKKEVQVIWSDYFKPEHLEKVPDLHSKVWNLLKLAGKNKQSVDADAAAQLVAAVQEFSDDFWSTKK
jgi:nickel superoxide dismutase